MDLCIDNAVKHFWHSHWNAKKNIFPAVTEAGKAGDSLAQDFFREEYILNNTIGMFSHFCCHFWGLMNIFKYLFILLINFFNFFIWTPFRYISETICGSNWWDYNGRSKYWSKIVILLQKFTSRWCLAEHGIKWTKGPEAMWASLSCFYKI